MCKKTFIFTNMRTSYVAVNLQELSTLWGRSWGMGGERGGGDGVKVLRLMGGHVTVGPFGDGTYKVAV